MEARGPRGPETPDDLLRGPDLSASQRYAFPVAAAVTGAGCLGLGVFFGLRRPARVGGEEEVAADRAASAPRRAAAAAGSKELSAAEAMMKPLPGTRMTMGGFAMRAFAYGTLLSVVTVGGLVVGVAVALDVRSAQEFSDRMTVLLPRVRRSLEESAAPIRRFLGVQKKTPAQMEAEAAEEAARAAKSAKEAEITQRDQAMLEALWKDLEKSDEENARARSERLRAKGWDKDR